MMTGIPDEFEHWLDGVRVQMYEDMQRLGKDEYHRQMDERVQEAAERYGFRIVKSAGEERRQAAIQ